MPHKLLPLPPFAKRLERLLTEQKLPANSVFTWIGVNSWEKAKAFSISQYVLCLPYGSHPKTYRWPVSNCSILMIDTGGVEPELIRNFAFILLSSGAMTVHVIRPSKRMVIYRRKNHDPS